MSNDYDELIPFPFEADFAQPIVETFGYLTDVIVSENGTEQRVQLRTIPTGSISMRILRIKGTEPQLHNALVHGHLSKPFAVGRWQFATALTEDADRGDTTISCDTENIPFMVGGFVLLWRDALHVEVRVIEGIDPGVIMLHAGVVADETILGVQQGEAYDLAEQGVLGVLVSGPGGTPIYTDGDDYLIDAWKGQIYIVPGGGIPNDADLDLQYDYGALANDWQAGVTNVVPAVVGRLSPSESLQWDSLMVCSQDAVFDVDGFS